MQPRFTFHRGRRAVCTLAPLATLAALLACQNEASPIAAPYQAEQGIGIALPTGALSVSQGQSVSIVVTVWRSGGFTGAIALEVTGAPSGVTPTLDADVVLMGSSTSTLTLAATETVVPGTYPLTVRANGTGVDEESASLVLTVMPAATPAIRVALTPGTISLTRGQSGSVGVFVSRIGAFTGAVALTVTGAPAGVNPTFSPASILPGEGSTLALVTAPSTVAGVYTLTVTGSGSGVASHSVLLSLTVTDPIPPYIGVSFIPPGDFVWTVQGDSWTWPGVTITRYGGYTGVVELTIEGLPSDVEGSFSPNPLDAGTTTSAVTFTAVPSAGLGSWDVTIRARGDGVPDATSVFRLVVFPPADD